MKKHIRIILPLALFLVSVVSITEALAQRKNKALIIAVDGLTPAGLDFSKTVFIDQLKDNSTYSFEAKAFAPTYNATTWTSLLTGVWSQKHGVVDEESMGEYDPAAYPSLLDYIETVDPDKGTVSIVNSAVIHNDIIQNADHRARYATDDEVAEQAKAYLSATENLDVGFVQFGSVLQAGIEGGFTGASAEYVLAVQHADTLVGKVVEGIESRANYLNEDWVIILTSSHNGTVSGEFGGSSFEEETIPYIISGHSVDNTELQATEGKDNAISLNFGMVAGFHPTKFDLTDMTMEVTLKQTAKRGGWQSIFDTDNDQNLIALQGETLRMYGRCTNTVISNDFRFNIGVEYHIALVIKGVTWTVYVDGEQIGTGDTCEEDARDVNSVGFGGGVRNSGDPGADHSGDEPFLGIFNEARIWNTALDPEIINQYKDQRDIEISDHPELGSLVAYYKFDEVSGSLVKDYSGNNIHAQAEATWSRVPGKGFALIDAYPTVLTHLGLDIPAVDGNAFIIEPALVLDVDEERIEARSLADFNLFPNPAVDVLNIRMSDKLRNTGEVRLQVYDAGGRLLLQNSMGGAALDEIIEVDISSLQKGYFMFTLEGNGFAHSGRFIVNR